MKVLKDGMLGDPSNWNTVITCRKRDDHDSDGCGAELEVSVTDLVIMYYEGTHTRHHYAAARCPQCGKYTHVGKLPTPVWEKIFTPKSEKNALFDGLSESL